MVWCGLDISLVVALLTGKFIALPLGFEIIIISNCIE